MLRQVIEVLLLKALSSVNKPHAEMPADMSLESIPAQTDHAQVAN
jgi:hypothetical protein